MNQPWRVWLLLCTCTCYELASTFPVFAATACARVSHCSCGKQCSCERPFLNQPQEPLPSTNPQSPRAQGQEAVWGRPLSHPTWRFLTAKPLPACPPACPPAEHVGKSLEEVRAHFLATYIEHEGAPLPRRELAMQGVSAGDWRRCVLVRLGRWVLASRCAKHAAEHGMPGEPPAAGCPALCSGVPAKGLCQLSTSGRPCAHPCFPSHCTPPAGGY